MRRLIARARAEGGFTMATVMAVMLCVTLLSIAALAAAQGDLRPGAHDKGRKIAFAAAEAGVQNYLFHLNRDLDYWAKCTTGAQPHAVNDAWNGTSPATDPRRWTALAASGSRYAIELMPANGAAACSTATPQETMIDAGSGTFKIRSTGQDTASGVKRSIVATFKRKSFLDYLYFTDKEVRAPGLYGMDIKSDQTRETTGARRDLLTWAKQQCERYHGDDPAQGQRQAQYSAGEYYDYSTASWQSFPMRCRDGEFKQGDVVAGPLHTNDELLIECGSGTPPQLGDSVDDVVETSGLGRVPTTPADPDAGWRGCAPLVNFSTSTLQQYGTWKAHAPPLTLPPSNAQLKADAASAYRFQGATSIVLQGTTMRVTGKREDGTVLTSSTVAIPDGGAVFVSHDGACPDYVATNSAAAPATCGTLELRGDYAANVTFGAENDILVKDDLVRTTAGSQHLLGLIATNYVRVDNPVTNCNPSSPVTCNYIGGCTNLHPVSDADVFTIEAAILSLTRSFIVDNWFCGAKLGKLEIYGAIAQMYRGPVSRESSDPATGSRTFTGYAKDYLYDYRLKFRAPPHFLDPVQAQWRVQTFSEQAPAR